MRVILMSGISGAGKDTWIAKNHPEAAVVSADSFFMKDGSYTFDASKLGEAHSFCIRRFIELVRIVYPTILVNNTNLTSEEIAPYYAIGKAYGYEVELVTLYCRPKVAADRNSHGVSLETCIGMLSRLNMRVIPPYWELNQSVQDTNS